METLGLSIKGCPSVTIISNQKKASTRARRNTRGKKRPRGATGSSSSRRSSSLRSSLKKLVGGIARQGSEEHAQRLEEVISEREAQLRAAEEDPQLFLDLASLDEAMAVALEASGSGPYCAISQCRSRSQKNRKRALDVRDGIVSRRFKSRCEKFRKAIESVDRAEAERLARDFEIAEGNQGDDMPCLVDNDMTCGCGRPLVVVVDGALAGCSVCRTVERIQPKVPVGAAAPSSRAARASRSPGTIIEMISAQSEARVRDLMLSVQGLGAQASDKEIQDTAQWMVSTNRHPLIDHAGEILRCFLKRGKRKWENWQDVQDSLSSKVQDALKTLNGPSVRDLRTLMKREGHKITTYEDAQSIASGLVGLAPPKISASLFEYVCSLLRQAYPVYESASKSGENFWGGYPYFLRCVMLLLGRDEYLPYINLPSLKNKEEVRRHLWRALKWEFVPADPRAEVAAIEYVAEKAKAGRRVLVKNRKRMREVMKSATRHFGSVMRSVHRARVSVRK